MADKQLQPVVMEGMRIIFRNFEGKESEYNQKGAKNFGVVLPPDVAERMLADGWNVKYAQAQRGGEGGGPRGGSAVAPVKVRFDVGKPPKVMMITSRGKYPHSTTPRSRCSTGPTSPDDRSDRAPLPLDQRVRRDGRLGLPAVDVHHHRGGRARAQVRGQT
jgi:hypothetical protein